MPAPLLMIVEDHPLLRQSTVLALQTLGYSAPLTASNGLDALQQLRRNGGVDIAICDIRMPEMDGMTFLRLAAQEQLIRAVILVSELSDELRRAILHLAGMHGLQVLGELGKPAGLTPLAEQITAYQATEKSSSPKAQISISDKEIAEALRKRELEINLQPKIKLSSELEYGSEALIRWKHPEHGKLSPAHFLQQLRSQNLQFELTKFVLEECMELIASEIAIQRSSSISINLEIADLQKTELISHIESRLKHYRIPAHTLTFEITEGELDHSPATSLESLIRLRMLGCGVSIDDFGTGYSSLQRLCDTPCTEIKLDASFVRRMTSNLRAHESIASTISLARHLGLSVVAEGIETPEQLQLLKVLGCDAGQGYLFAAPMPVEHYVHWRGDRQESMAPDITAHIH